MSRKILYVAAGYLLGNLVSSLYNEKKGGEMQKDIKKAEAKGEDVLSLIFRNFYTTQKRFFSELKDVAISQENEIFLKTQKDKLNTLLEKYKVEGEELLGSVKTKGKGYVDNALKKLNTFYNEKRLEGGESLKQFGEKVVSEFEVKFTLLIDNLKSKIK